MLLLYWWFIFNPFLLADPNWKWFFFKPVLVSDYFWWLFISSYLPRIIAESFCRGLSSSHTAAAGRASRRAEVWRWCCSRAGGVFTKLQAPTTGWRKALAKTVFTAPWQLPWGRSVDTLVAECPACLQPRRHRDRFTGSEQKRLRFKTLTQRNTILFASAFPHSL